MGSAASKNPAAVAQKWATNLGNSTASIKAGVQAVQTAPGQLAAANQAGYLSGVQQSVQKWANNVASVSLTSWQNATINKGINHIGSGATGAIPKMTSFMSQLLPYVAQGQQSLSSTPRGSLDQNIQRSVSFQRFMANFQYNKQGG